MARAMSPALIGLVAEQFKALSDPGRLLILNVLRRGEQTVGELVEETGLQQANLSRHLQVLHRHGFVRRAKEGQFVRYALADARVFELCDVMCGQLEATGRMPRRRTA